MQWITEKVQSQGARILEEEIQALEELTGSCDLVINCSGVWARHLVDDPEVYPIRGQVIVTEKLQGITLPVTTYDSGELPAYIVPRKNDCLLGGTAQMNNWDLEASPDMAKAIQERCRELLPSVPKLEVMSHKVGLRPGRESVRLELDLSRPELPVIHNYGHGGSGYTLCWGCADEVSNLLKRLEE